MRFRRSRIRSRSRGRSRRRGRSFKTKRVRPMRVGYRF